MQPSSTTTFWTFESDGRSNMMSSKACSMIDLRPRAPVRRSSARLAMAGWPLDIRVRPLPWPAVSVLPRGVLGLREDLHQYAASSPFRRRRRQAADEFRMRPYLMRSWLDVVQERPILGGRSASHLARSPCPSDPSGSDHLLRAEGPPHEEDVRGVDLHELLVRVLAPPRAAPRRWCLRSASERLLHASPLTSRVMEGLSLFERSVDPPM